MITGFICFFRLVNAFAGQISAAVESAITKKIKDGVLKVDSLLQNLPKRVLVDKVAELNVSFVNQPLLLDSSVELDINGLFIAKEKSAIQRFYGSYFLSQVSCRGPSKMLSMSLDEIVFNSAARVYFDVSPYLISFELRHFLSFDLPICDSCFSAYKNQEFPT